MWGRFGVYSRRCFQVEGEPVTSGGALDVVDLTTSIALLSGVDLRIPTRLARRARETQFAMYPRFSSILSSSMVQFVSTPQTFPLPPSHTTLPLPSLTRSLSPFLPRSTLFDLDFISLPVDLLHQHQPLSRCSPSAPSSNHRSTNKTTTKKMSHRKVSRATRSSGRHC